MDVRKNDTVKVLSGKEKGKSGKVLEVLHEKNRVRVEKLMTVKRHLKKGRSQSNPDGGIVERAGAKRGVSDSPVQTPIQVACRASAHQPQHRGGARDQGPEPGAADGPGEDQPLVVAPGHAVQRQDRGTVAE